MAATYTPDILRKLFQSSFNLTQWYTFLQYFFNATELKEGPEKIIGSTSDRYYRQLSYRFISLQYYKRLGRKQACSATQSCKVIH